LIFSGGKTGNKVKLENKNRVASSTAVPQSEEDYEMHLPSQLMGLASAWGTGLRQVNETQKGRKRSLSPQAQEGAKHAKLMLLQQGDGPSLGMDN